MNWREVANITPIWIVCSVAVFITFFQAIIFYKIAKKVANNLNIPIEKQKIAFKVGAISAIGPSIAVLFSLFGLMAVIGAPMSWMRLSMIGSAATELAASSIAAESINVDFSKGTYTAQNLSLFWAAMGLNGVGWLLSVLFFANHLDGLRNKIGKGDAVWLGMFSTSAMLGIFGYLMSSDLQRGTPEIAASIAGLLTAFVVTIISKRWATIKEYTLGIAVIIGVCVGIMVG